MFHKQSTASWPWQNWPLYHALSFAYRPMEFLAQLHSTQGDGFLLRLPGLGDITVTGTAAGAREIFSATPDNFGSLENSPVEPILGLDSLMLTSGERHLRERKLLSPPFRGPCLRGFGDSIQRDAVEGLESSLTTPAIMLQDLFRGIALNVIIGCVFGVQEPRRKAHFHAAISAMMKAYTTPLMLFPALRLSLLGLTPWDRYIQARAVVHQLLREEIRDRQSRRTPSHDVLSRLLDLRHEDGSSPTEESLVSLLCTLLVAGHETSTISLTWALYYVLSHPSAQARLLAELSPKAKADELLDAPYLNAVCQETLRLQPAVPAAVRRLAKPLSLAGKSLSPGDNAAVALTVLHRDPRVFPEPSRFLPERFLTRRYSPFQYAPFGGGHRRCIGETFALFEMRVVLGTILSRALLRVPPQSSPRPAIRGIAMGPDRPIVATVKSV